MPNQQLAGMYMEYYDVEKAWEGVTNSIGAEEWMGAFKAGWSEMKNQSE